MMSMVGLGLYYLSNRDGAVTQPNLAPTGVLDVKRYHSILPDNKTRRVMSYDGNKDPIEDYVASGLLPLI